MPINTKTDYIEIGTSVEGSTLKNVLSLPAPHEIPTTNEFLADADRNANGTMIIQQIGRTQYKTNIKWNTLQNRKYWELNRWFQTYGYVFYMKYFCHTDGTVKIQKFYRGNMEAASPSSEQEIIDNLRVPKYYNGVGFSIIDMGESYIKTIQSIRL